MSIMANKYHLKTYLLTSYLVDFATAVINPRKTEYHLLAIACISIAAQMSDFDEKEVFYNSGTYSTINDYINMRLIILEHLNYDLIFTTPYDYYQDSIAANMNNKEWNLTKAMMIITTMSDIRLKEYANHIFYICTGFSLRYYKKPLNEIMKEMFIAHDLELMKIIRRQYKTTRTGIKEYFNKITKNSPTLEDIKRYIDTVS